MAALLYLLSKRSKLDAVPCCEATANMYSVYVHMHALSHDAQVDAEELKLIIAVIVFSGAFANGIATLLQVGAQRDVGPSRAQLIYR
jgi:hypothetical protein